MDDTTPGPDDFIPEPDAGEGLPAKDEVGGPGGIINYPEDTWPEGWEYVEGESSPKVGVN